MKREMSQEDEIQEEDHENEEQFLTKGHEARRKSVRKETSNQNQSAYKITKHNKIERDSIPK